MEDGHWANSSQHQQRRAVDAASISGSVMATALRPLANTGILHCVQDDDSTRVGTRVLQQGSECRNPFLSTIVIPVFSGCHSRLMVVIPEGESAFVLVVPDLLHHLKSASNIMGSATSLLEHGHPIVIERHLGNLSSIQHIRHTSL